MSGETSMEQLLSPYLVALFWISVLMPIGIFLRFKIAIFQRYLVPSSLITGLLGLVMMNLGLVGYPSPGGWVQIEHHVFAMLVTLIFTANFILIGINAGKPAESSNKSQEIRRGVAWLSITFVGGYGLLIMCGIPIIWIYNTLTSSALEPASSINLVQGFVGGPAQALTVSQIWVDNAARTDIQHLWNISPDVLVMAVSYGAAGFLVAAFVGVSLANYGVRKSVATYTSASMLDTAFRKGILPKDTNQAIGRHTLHPANMDTITFHMALLGIAFFFTWIFCYCLKQVLPTDISGIAFGMMFMWGMFCAIVVRKIVVATGNNHLVDEQIVNRLNGVCVDYMMVAALMGVELAVLGKYLVPFLLSVVLGTWLLFVWFWKTSRWLEHNGLERFLVNFAACTGTLASSILLMRIVDPEGKSTVLAEVGFSQFAMMVPVMPLAVFLIPALGVKTTISMVLYAGILIFAVCLVLMLVLKKRGYWQEFVRYR